MKQRCLFEVIVAESKVQQDDYSFILREEEITDEQGKIQTINIVESIANSIGVGREAEIKDIVDEADTAKELKYSLESNGFKILADIDNKDILKSISSKHKNVECPYECQRWSCKCLEDAIKVESAPIAFYIMNLVGECIEELKDKVYEIRGIAGKVMVWSTRPQCKDNERIEYFVFIVSKTNKK